MFAARRKAALALRRVRPFHLDSSDPTIRNPKEGYVYIVTDGEGYYKIGCTVDLDQRMGRFSQQWRVEPKYVHVIQTDDMMRLEAALHERFAVKRVNPKREWFRLSKADIEWIRMLK